MKLSNINPEKIIIIDLLYLGDLMFATPFIKELRNNFPDTRIDMVVNSAFYSIMEDNPYLNNIYSYNKKWSTKNSIKFARKLAKYEYDLGLNIHGNWRTALLLKLINPKYTVGYGGKGRGIFLDQIMEQSDGKHVVDNYLDFLREVGLKVENSIPHIEVSKESKKNIQVKLRNWGVSAGDRLIALNTGGTWTTKRWMIEGFAGLADRLNKDYGRVIFVGSEIDLVRVEQIINLMETEPIIAAGETSLKELAALLEQCDLVISNDSGPVHVAAVVGTPTITIFGPSDDRKYRPLGDKDKIIKNQIDCRPCGEHECPLGHHKCMQDIKIDDIINAINKMGCFR